MSEIIDHEDVKGEMNGEVKPAGQYLQVLSRTSPIYTLLFPPLSLFSPSLPLSLPPTLSPSPSPSQVWLCSRPPQRDEIRAMVTQ